MRDTKKVTFHYTDLIQCSLETCLKCVRADDALWDDKMDLPYCSRNHRSEDQTNQMLKTWDIEDYILYGDSK